MGPLSHSIVDTVVSIKCARNIIVLKTTPGMAQAVAIAVDRLPEEEIVGSVAGDDTIIAVAPDEDIAKNVSMKLKRLLSLG